MKSIIDTLGMIRNAVEQYDELDIIDMLKVMSEEELKKAKELAKKIRRDKKLQTLLDESG